MKANSNVKKYLDSILQIQSISSYYILFSDNKKYYYKEISYYLKDIFDYFSLINFRFALPLISSLDDPFLLVEYDESKDYSTLEISSDMIHHLSLLHEKSMDYVIYTEEKKKELYDKNFYLIRSRIKYFEELEKNILEYDFPPPKYYLLLKNISKIYRLLNFSLNKLDEWYEYDESRERISFLVEDVSLENYSYKYSSFYDYGSLKKDIFLYDFVSFYQSEYYKCDMNQLFYLYQKNIPFSKSELSLFYSLISIPFTVSFTDHSFADTIRVRELVDYVDSTELFLSKEYKKNQEANKEVFKEENNDV